jgi:hypothetical protein
MNPQYIKVAILAGAGCQELGRVCINIALICIFINTFNLIASNCIAFSCIASNCNTFSRIASNCNTLSRIASNWIPLSSSYNTYIALGSSYIYIFDVQGFYYTRCAYVGK